MVPRSAEECRKLSSSAGKGWGRHWGAFKLLYYHCNTTKIDRVEQPRTVCGAEEVSLLLLLLLPIITRTGILIRMMKITN